MGKTSLTKSAAALALAGACALASGAPLWAQNSDGEAELRPAPDYFVETVAAMNLARVMAKNCKGLTVSPAAAEASGEATLEMLAADGFPADNPTALMEDPNPQVAERQSAFLASYELQDANSVAQICAAGLQEIAKQTPLGSLLVEVRS